MTTPGPRFSTLALRLLVVLPVLAGVLVMHGLTSDHDIAMATMAGAGAHSPMTSMSSPHAAEHANQGTPGPDGMVAEKAVFSTLDTAQGGHAMGPVCLGVLTVTVLALLLARARGLPRQGGLACALWPALRSPSPPPSRIRGGPSLTRLCISRT